MEAKLIRVMEALVVDHQKRSNDIEAGTRL